MFRTVAGIIVFVTILTVQQSFADTKDSGAFLNKHKLTEPDTIIDRFDRGESYVKVTINMYDNEGILSKDNIRSAKYMSQRRKAIYGRQKKVLEDIGGSEFYLRHRFENIASFSCEVSSSKLRQLSNDSRVESIEPVLTLYPHLSQGIDLINATTTRTAYNGQGLSIAICDTGVDYTHPALGNGGFPNGKVIGGYDFADRDSDPAPDGDAHGTCCAGIAAGNVINYGDYIGGVAYGAKIYALKITSGSSGSASNDDLAAAWDWCVTHQNDDPENPIMVISTSFGGGQYSSTCNTANPSMTAAANNAVAAGITVLASSGNDGYCNAISSPSCISNVISVGAVYDGALGTYGFCVDSDSCADENGSFACDTGLIASWQTTGADVVAVYSNTSPVLDVLAPAHNAYTTDIVGSEGESTGNYYSSFGGTSAACPYAAGAVAILQSAAKSITGSYLTPEQIRILITETGDDIADEKIPSIVKPRIDVGAAVFYLDRNPPTAEDIDAITETGTSVTITLSASDEGLPDPPGQLSYVITSLPSHGELIDINGAAIVEAGFTLSSDKVVYTPRSGCQAPVTFNYVANDGGTSPDGGDSNEAIVRVSVSGVVMNEDFESGTGIFTINNDFDSGSGLWHLTNGCGAKLTGHSGGTALYFGSDETCTYSSWISEGVAVSEVIELPDKSGVGLKFSYLLETEDYTGYDIASVEISENGGQFVRMMSNYSGTLDDPSDGWTTATIDLSGSAGSDVKIRFHFDTVDNLYNTLAGFYVDDVKILASDYEQIDGDFEPDCDVDTDDLMIIAGNWLASCGDCNGADLLADGVVDLNDLAVFAANWLAGVE